MEKSTKIYIGVGIGAIVLGYIYLKRKQSQAVKMLQEQAGLPVEEGQEGEQESATPTASGGGGGGGAVSGGATSSSTPTTTPSLFAPLMSLVTPVAVTPTTSTTSTPVSTTVSASTPTRTPPSISNVLSSAIPNVSPVVPVRGNTGNTFAGVVRPTMTTTTPRAVTPTVVRPTLTAVPSGRSGFNGMNNESFELGDCLTDL